MEKEAKQPLSTNQPSNQATNNQPPREPNKQSRSMMKILMMMFFSSDFAPVAFDQKKHLDLTVRRARK